MDNLWSRMNEEVPIYMHDIIEKYSMSSIKLSSVKTALICKNYCLIISIDRFEATIAYLYKKNDEYIVLQCDNYFASKYDTYDREGLIEGTGAEISIINSLKILSTGMQSKWRDVLEGNMSWIKKYEESKWFEEDRLADCEMEILREKF